MFNTQFTVNESVIKSGLFTKPGDPIEILYDLKYADSGEPYLVPNGKKRNVYDEIQKAQVMLVDIADLYERALQGEDCLNIVFGGEYLDISVFDSDMIVNANRAYQEQLKSLNPGSEKVTEKTESEEKSE